MPQRIADSLRQARGGGDAPALLLEPDMQGIHDGPTSRLPRLPSIVGGMAADLGFDLIEIANAFQHLGCQRRLGGGVEVVELPPRVGPAKCQRYRSVRTRPGQPLEPGITIDLKHAAEPGQMLGRMRALAVLV